MLNHGDGDRINGKAHVRRVLGEGGLPYPAFGGTARMHCPARVGQHARRILLRMTLASESRGTAMLPYSKRPSRSSCCSVGGEARRAGRSAQRRLRTAHRAQPR
jgi:hypothetical protein